MNRVILAALLCAAPLLGGCPMDAPAGPVLCLLGAGVDPATHACAGVTPPVLAAGDAYFIRHELPAGVTPPGTVHLRIETPCGAVETDASYGEGADAGPAVGRFALVARVAPPGAECGVTVTATIANSALVVTSKPGACAQPLCPDAGGAGGAATTSAAGGAGGAATTTTTGTGGVGGGP